MHHVILHKILFVHVIVFTCAINWMILTKILRGMSLGTTLRDPLGKSVVTMVVRRLWTQRRKRRGFKSFKSLCKITQTTVVNSFVKYSIDLKFILGVFNKPSLTRLGFLTWARAHNNICKRLIKLWATTTDNVVWPDPEHALRQYLFLQMPIKSPTSGGCKNISTDVFSRNRHFSPWPSMAWADKIKTLWETIRAR